MCLFFIFLRCKTWETRESEKGLEQDLQQGGAEGECDAKIETAKRLLNMSFALSDMV